MDVPSSADEEEEAALTWKALQEENSDDEEREGDTPVIVGNGGSADEVDLAGLEDDVEDDDDAFARLGDLPPFSTGTSALLERDEDSNIHESDQVLLVASPDVTLVQPPPPPLVAYRAKRKNFSKDLQLRSLQRYVDYWRDHTKLPDRSECERLLEHSFADFVREGGSAEHPRLTHSEFLKLIRNRSCERRQKVQTATAVSASDTHQRSTTATDPTTGLSCQKSTAQARKRKRAREYDDKITELVAVIDRARLRSSHSAGSETKLSQAPTQQLQVSSRTDSTPTASTASEDVMDSILRLQQETLGVQRTIQERLANLHDLYGVQEPASASV